MIHAFDRIVINVPDLALAAAQYQQLLAVVPFPCLTHRGLNAVWLGLSNTVIELVESEVQSPVIAGIAFSDKPMAGGDRTVSNPLQLHISLSDGSGTDEYRRQLALQLPSPHGMSVDHLVLRTGDAQACIDLFAEELGLRLALDKTVPEWGGRMLFFRTGKLTLEVIAADPEQHHSDYFWGIAYQCADLLRLSRDLEERGVALSEIRDGRKPGTRVATLKSHCLGIPTLLVQPAT
ncbi:MAG: VOC family protein [Halioglobus sp.]